MDKKGPGDMGRSIGGFKTNDPLSYQLRMDYDGQAWCGATLISSNSKIIYRTCTEQFNTIMILYIYFNYNILRPMR